jgi:hypothetical protein
MDGTLMKIIDSQALPFIPAGHEDPRAPNAWKKVVFQKADLQLGEVHEMRNVGNEDVEYLAIGITAGTGGRTIVVEQT